MEKTKDFANLQGLKFETKTRYLEGLSEAAYILLGVENEIPYNEYLACLGKASGTSRVYVFLNSRDKKGKLLLSQTGEWCNEGIDPQIDNPELQNMPFEESVPRWCDILFKGGIIQGSVLSFPDSERRYLEPQGIKSLLVLPLIYKQELFGFIGFDNCSEDRPWREDEIDYLKTAAAGLTQAIHRLNIERELKKSQEKFKTILDSLPAAVQGFDTQGKILYWNKANENLYGYHESEVLGKNIADLIVPESLKPLFKECLEAGKQANRSGCFFSSHELELVNKNSEKVQVYSVHTAVCTPGEEPVLFSIDVDISERKELERQLQIFNDELEKRLQERSWRLEMAYNELERQKKIQ